MKYFVLTLGFLFLQCGEQPGQVVENVNDVTVNEFYATGGEKAVDWTKRIKEEEEEGPGLWFACVNAPSEVKSSSHLKSQGSKSYESGNLSDWDPRTAWVEGKSGYGIGEFFEIKSEMGGNSFQILNGYQSSYSSWKKNSRVKVFKIYVDNEFIGNLHLQDLMGEQRFELPGNNYDKTIRFEIAEVYKGDTWDDVCISEISSVGCCFRDASVSVSEGSNVSLDGLQIEKDKIIVPQLESGQLGASTVQSIYHQEHNHVLHLKAGDNEIELTNTHPLNFKGYGFISPVKLMHDMGENDYTALENRVEVLVYNQQTEKMEYTVVLSVEELVGEFDTYTIGELSEGDTYIANGFVTKVYK